MREWEKHSRPEGEVRLSEHKVVEKLREWLFSGSNPRAIRLNSSGESRKIGAAR